MRTIVFVVLVMMAVSARGQIQLQCDERDQHSLYLVNSDWIYRIDSVDSNPTDPIQIESNSLYIGGISINGNLDSTASTVLTFYGCASDNYYYYWNGTSWSPTNHSTGLLTAANPGGTSDYIFNLDGINGNLVRYDGIGNTILLSGLNTSSGNATFDVATDNQGNFYLFFNNLNRIYCFDANGNALDTFITTGNSSIGSGSLALLGNNFYAISPNSDLYRGLVNGNNVYFTNIKHLSSPIDDMAACPNAANPLGIYKEQTPHQFAIYPNPASSNSQLTFNYSSAGSARGIVVNDINGKEIARYALPPWSTTQTVKLPEMASGVYVARMVGEGVSANVKFVIE